MVVGDDRKRSWAVGYVVVAVVWVNVQHCKVGQQALGQRSKTEPLGLSFRCTVVNNSQG